MAKTIDQIIRENFTQDFRTGTPYDDTDSPERFPLPGKWDGREFSACNAGVLIEVLSRRSFPVRMEIGVARLSTSKWEETSTWALADVGQYGGAYIGVDIEDRGFVVDTFLGRHIIQMDSTRVDEVLAAFDEKKITKRIDLLMIDGWHSINTVIQEFAYTDLIPVGGVVVMHDVNLHPGPKNAVEYANLEKWKVEKYCPDDWGIAVLTKLKP